MSRNNTDENVQSIIVNEEMFLSSELLGSLDSCTSDVFELSVLIVPGTDYSNITTIQFAVEIDDESNVTLARSKLVTVIMDANMETFSAKAE